MLSDAVEWAELVKDPYRLLTPGNPNGQCDGGVVQWQATAGVPE